MLSILQSSIHCVQWKYILYLALCLMTLHFLLVGDLYEAAENGKRALFSPSSSAASKFELGHTADAAPKEPHVETAALVEVQEKEKPHIEGCSGPKEQAAPDPDKSGISPHDGIKIDEHVAICISIKDQSEDLTEWLVHHYRHMSIQRFYIMDGTCVSLSFHFM
jgi:hypothetical protein